MEGLNNLNGNPYNIIIPADKDHAIVILKTTEFILKNDNLLKPFCKKRLRVKNAQIACTR